jgi:hypothetical protein
MKIDIIDIILIGILYVATIGKMGYSIRQIRADHAALEKRVSRIEGA